MSNISNIVPKGWNAAPISEICNIAIGGTPSRSVSEYWDSAKATGSPWVSIRDLSTPWIYETSEYITDLGIKNSNVKLVKKGTVLMSFKLSVGRVAFAGRDLYTNEAIVAFLPKEKVQLSNQFLYQGLQQWNLLENIDQAVKGITLNKEKINQIEALLPPLPEQQKIATILSSVDNVIEKTRAQIDKLKDLKTGMMQELLTKGIGHTEFKDSPVGRIPKGWDVGTLDSFGVSVLDGDRGKEYPKEKDFHSFEYCLFLSAKNVTKKGFVFSELSFITKEKDELLRKGKLTRGDIVITTRGTVGNIAFYDNEVAFNNIRINSGMAIIRNSSTVLDSQFLHLLMNSPMVGEQVDLLAFGSAQPQLTIGIIKNLDVPKPSLEEQKAITSAVTAMTTKLQLVNKKLNLLLSTKKALMQDLLTGKVRVNLNDSAAI